MAKQSEAAAQVDALANHLRMHKRLDLAERKIGELAARIVKLEKAIAPLKRANDEGRSFGKRLLEAARGVRS